MIVIQQELKNIFNRSLWLYLAAILIFSVGVDYDQAKKERSRYLLGIFYNQDLKNYKDGIVYFDYLIHQKPNDNRNYFLLGYCYLQLNDYDRAVRYFEKACTMSPDDLTYQQYLSHAQSKMRHDVNIIPLPPENIQITLE